MKTWILPVDGTMFRVVLEKDTLDIWVNGSKVLLALSSLKDLSFCIPMPRWKWPASSPTKELRLISPSDPSQPT